MRWKEDHFLFFSSSSLQFFLFLTHEWVFVIGRGASHPFLVLTSSSPLTVRSTYTNRHMHTTLLIHHPPFLYTTKYKVKNKSSNKPTQLYTICQNINYSYYVYFNVGILTLVEINELGGKLKKVKTGLLIKKDWKYYFTLEVKLQLVNYSRRKV